MFDPLDLYFLCLYNIYCIFLALFKVIAKEKKGGRVLSTENKGNHRSKYRVIDAYFYIAFKHAIWLIITIIARQISPITKNL